MGDPTNAEIDSACLSFRHDFGLMGIEDANRMRWTASEWLRSWRAVEEMNRPDHVEVLRAIKSSGARSHSDIAKVIADLYS